MNSIRMVAFSFLLLCAPAVFSQQNSCLTATCLLATTAQAAPPPPNIEVLYTARLLGYLRSDNQGYGGLVQKFRDNLEAAKIAHPQALFVGMGDNLAPEFGSRFVGNVSSPKPRIPGVGPVVDNVADILSLYDVVVPGKEDFYFGSERLRLIAPLAHMNATNLSQSVAFPSQDTEPNRYPITGFVDTHPNAKPIDDGHLVLTRSGGRHATFAVEFNDAELTNGTPPPLVVCPYSDRVGCAAPVTIAASANHYPSTTLNFQVYVYDLSTLTPALFPLGTRRLFCFNLHKPAQLSQPEWEKHGERFCRPMSIDGSLFPDFPYSRVTKNGMNFVVFPLVGVDIKQQVKQYDRTWRTSGHDYSVEVAFREPLITTRQAYYECKDNGDCNGSAQIVMLAQMALSSAEQLSGKLSKEIRPLRLVISKAETPSSAFGSDMDFHAGARQVPVIAPQPLYIENFACPNDPDPLAKAALYQPLHFAAVSNATFTNLRQVPNLPVVTDVSRDYCWNVKNGLPSTFETNALAAGNTGSLERFVSEELRDRVGGDAALVSKHEFFRDPLASPAGVSIMEAIERVVWEGSHISILRLSGKKLREALKASDSAPEDRQLVTAGIKSTDDGNYYINGKPLDDGAYYKIIAPDALVYGDALYSSLADETFAKPQADVETVAHFLCRRLGGPCPQNAPPDHAFPAAINPVQPFNDTAWDYIRSVFAPHHHDPLQNLDTASGCPAINCDNWIDKQAQLRTIYLAQLVKNDVSYSLSKANPDDKTVGTLFGGVTDPRVVKAHTEVLSIDHDLRLGRTSGRWLLGAEETLQFGRSRQGNTSGGGDSVSLTANKATIGPFMEAAIRRNAAPNWRLVLRPLDYSSNLSRTKTRVTGAKDATGNPTTFLEDLPALRSLSTKFGLRFEAPQRKDSLFASEGNSFVEFGYKSTWNLNTPTELTLNAGTPFAKPCSLVTADPSLSACASTVTAVGVATVTKFDLSQLNGGYWTMLFRIPLSKLFTYKVGSDGEFRASTGTSAEARYAISFDNYLQTRVWGNFGVAPHIGWFFYENQVDFHTLQRHTVDITVTYNFNWHTGLGKKAFFMAPATAAK